MALQMLLLTLHDLETNHAEQGGENTPFPTSPPWENPQNTSGGHHQFLGKGVRPVHMQLGLLFVHVSM